MLLFGFSYNLIIGLKIENYCVEKRTLRIEYKRNGKQHFIVEMPYLLAKELESYLAEREIKDRDFLFVTRDNTQISNAFIKDTLDDIYNDCQNEVNMQKEINRNRYVNHFLRGIATFDEI